MEVEARLIGSNIHDSFQNPVIPMFKLSERCGANGGAYCGEGGLYLGPVALIERDGDGYRVRPAAEIASLLAAAYDDPPDVGRCLGGIKRVTSFLQDHNAALAQIEALHLALPNVAPGRIERMARTDELLRANFNPSQPRDERGRWTDESGGGEAGNIIPASTRARPSRNPRAWEDFSNPDFRNRLAIAEQSAGRPEFGYREVHDSRDPHGGRRLALGRYQLTPIALQAAGMMDKAGNWTGKYGVHSQTQFLTNPEAQERALSDYLRDTERRLERNGGFAYIGATIDGLVDRFPVTRAGVIAAAHRHGAPRTRDYLDRVAANGFASRGLTLSPEERAIETRLRTFADATYE